MILNGYPIILIGNWKALKMIHLFVPSKDRASQLQLLLDSIATYMPNVFNVYVLYNYSNDDFKDGYDRLIDNDINKKLNIEYVKETDFIQQFQEFLKQEYKYCCLFTDDCVIFRNPNLTIKDIEQAFTKQTWCLSLRLGENTIIQNYLTGEQQWFLIPDEVNDELFSWNFRKYPSNYNYGYAFSWDGVFYRKADIVPWIYAVKTDDIINHDIIPTQKIEIYINHRREQIPYPYITALQGSSVVCLSCNITHPHNDNYGKTYNYSLESLNDSYLQGKHINLSKIDFADIQSSHIEKEFIIE